MFSYITTSYLLSATGLAVYWFLIRPHFSAFQRKASLLCVVVLALGLPLAYPVAWPELATEDHAAKAHAEREFKRTLNVVDINDPALLVCYEKAKNSKEFCQCEVVQKANVVVYKPSQTHNTILTAGKWLSVLFMGFALFALLDLGLKIAYLLHLPWRSKQTKTYIDNLWVTLLDTKQPLPLSSFRFGKPYIIQGKELDKLPSKERRATLLHEAAHLKHFDTWLLVTLQLLRTIWWLNPVYYFLKNELCLLAELMADEYAIKSSAFAPKDYARLLLDMKSQGSLSPSLAFGGSLIRARVMALLKPYRPQPRWKTYTAVLSLALTLTLICGFIMPSMVAYERQINTYGLMHDEHCKSGKIYFCKSCLLEGLKNGTPIK